MKERLVVIGNGMAGARLVEEIVARGGNERYQIVVFGDEPYGNYNRILLSNVLAGSHDPQDIFINPLTWYAQHHIDLRVGMHIHTIDTENKAVYASDGTITTYDKLVIATGSKPFLPPLKNLLREDGGLKTGAFAFRTIDDCDAMIKYAAQARSAVVIGGGLLGLEAARGLSNRCSKVHVVHLPTSLMNVQLDEPASELLQAEIAKLGIQLWLGKLTTEVVGETSVTGLGFKDGTRLECDMLVIAAGIRPNMELARQAGIACERGVLVNDGLVTSAQDVFALGECAEHQGRVYGLVAPLWEQARVLAERLTSPTANALYRGSKESTKLKVMGMELAVMGEKDRSLPDDEVVTYSEPGRGIYKKLVIRNGSLLGAIVMGDGPTTPRLLQHFDRGDKLPENRAELLFALTGESKAFDVADLPDDAQICNCNGVSKGQIVAAVREGKRSLPMLCNATRAGTGCGSCKLQVQALLELASDGLVVDDPALHYYVPGVPLKKPDLIKAIKEQELRSVSAVFRALADGKEDPTSKAGLASLLKTIWGKEYEDERDARFINDRVHANIQNDGTFSVIPRIYGGVTTGQELRRIADVALKYDVPMVKLTGGQRIDLVGIPKRHLPDVWRDLGMPSGHAYSKAFRTCKTCLGSEFCRYGVGDSTGLGIKIEKRFQGVESPHKMKLATTGCPRNCSEATTKDLGAMAIEGGRWEIYIGGGAGSKVRKGDVLCTVETHDEVLLYMGRFMQYYRENARYLERTYDLVERLGIEYLRQVLVEDSEGIASRLDQEIQAAVDAYVDPWQEAHQPVTPAQFAEALQPVGSTIVS
ncbi:nitrite reductase large subunit NirB [Ktedonobacter robiniae]|uniref:Nitrite reductase [NAD(P)H] n=1 Tax=Ktedonobacter robiniae TaxID=2778365 RepID=A0ABQ3V2C2_9CHLR|nr:nitrite reductase large subunit NirB [Ktedonobacter robiniae]GHO58722.1 nitrite reductase [NAD(P)H] [Ktedonobacter robiniae]